MTHHPFGRGSFPTHSSAAAPASRLATISFRRHLTAGLWFLVFGLPSSILNLPAAATPAAVPQDLGRNLSYVRLHRLPDDAAALGAAWKMPALIVDLRYTVGDDARALPSDLPPRPRTAPLFVLVGPDTAPALFAAMRERAPALISIGLAAPGLIPDIALSVSPATDRRAYDALDGGASVESLISEQLAKPRFDEATLAHEHAADAAAGDSAAAPAPAPTDAPPAAAPPPTTPAAPAAAPAPEAAPKDGVLQRAVQLHRALLALGKLPPG
jgi:hypothetical protein